MSIMASVGQARSPSVERAFKILEFLDSSRRSWKISEISRRLEMPKSTTHILVRTLAGMDYLKYDPATRSFSLGLKLSGLGRSVLKDMPMPARALPFMRSLADSLHMTIHLALLERDQAVYIQKVDGPGFIRFDTYVGKRTNLHCTAVGKVLLAHSSGEMQNKYLKRTTFIRHTRQTITSAPALKKELAKVAQQGWAIDDEEEELEVRCFAVPLYDRAGQTVAAALGATGTVGQASPQSFAKIVQKMQAVAAQIQNCLP
jgi:DNA-binding IclR family transcriptional regulator